MWPVLAAVITTLVAYLVLIRLPGPMGKVMAILPMVVGAALVFSLVEALFILPSHLYEFSRAPKGVNEPSKEEKARWLSPGAELPRSMDANNEESPGEARWFLRLTAGFRWLLTRLTRYWHVSLAVLVVGFVGLVMPHLLRLLLGPDHRVLVPACIFGGGAYMVVCDLLARVLPEQGEMPAGVVTALIGAPLFIYLLRRTER